MNLQYFRQPFKQLTTQEVLAKGHAFQRLTSVKEVADMLMCEEQWMREQATKPSYSSFKAPKPNGTFRQIDHPAPKLKEPLRALADRLQGIYYGIRPRASHAYVPTTADEIGPVNIYTNALPHCKSKWVFQVDLKDFFHSISAQRVKNLFQSVPFSFSEDAAQILARFVTYRGRLPIGTPTSPVLSNLICIELDHRLDKLARDRKWIYTRFSDDLTFSGPKRFSQGDMDAIRQIIEDQDFVLNYEKISQSSIDSEPEVCGLALKPNGKPDLSGQFVKDLKKSIKIYRMLTSDEWVGEDVFPAEMLNRFRQHIEGQLAFVRFVKGPNNNLYLKLRFLLNDGLLGRLQGEGD